MDRMLRLNDVIKKVGLRCSTIYKKIKEGGFPPPVKLGKRASSWSESALDQCLSQQLSASA